MSQANSEEQRSYGYRGPSIDHTVLSPSGRVSKAARKAALKSEAARLFPPGFWSEPQKSAAEQGAREGGIASPIGRQPSPSRRAGYEQAEVHARSGAHGSGSRRLGGRVTISQSNSASGAPSEETSEPKGEIGGECACAACMNELEQITAERDAYRASLEQIRDCDRRRDAQQWLVFRRKEGSS